MPQSVGNELHWFEQILSPLNFLYKIFLYSRSVEVTRNDTCYYRSVSYKNTLTLTEGNVVKRELQADAFSVRYIYSLTHSLTLFTQRT